MYHDADEELTALNGRACSTSSCLSIFLFRLALTYLNRVEDALEIANIKYDRLDGTMKREDRTKAMDALKHDPSCEVLLVSLKAGGVGLNLTAAQRVYLMDPYWWVQCVAIPHSMC